jgi:hypothetical protein
MRKLSLHFSSEVYAAFSSVTISQHCEHEMGCVCVEGAVMVDLKSLLFCLAGVTEKARPHAVCMPL